LIIGNAVICVKHAAHWVVVQFAKPLTAKAAKVHEGNI